MDLGHDQACLLWQLATRLVSLQYTRPPHLGIRLMRIIDSSQAMDVGTLKSLQADTIRVLVWILSFMTFGYATGEFEVTADRLGVYRPEEHIE